MASANSISSMLGKRRSSFGNMAHSAAHTAIAVGKTLSLAKSASRKTRPRASTIAAGVSEISVPSVPHEKSRSKSVPGPLEVAQARRRQLKKQAKAGPGVGGGARDREDDESFFSSDSDENNTARNNNNGSIDSTSARKKKKTKITEKKKTGTASASSNRKEGDDRGPSSLNEVAEQMRLRQTDAKLQRNSPKKTERIDSLMGRITTSIGLSLAKRLQRGKSLTPSEDGPGTGEASVSQAGGPFPDLPARRVQDPENFKNVYDPLEAGPSSGGATNSGKGTSAHAAGSRSDDPENGVMTAGGPWSALTAAKEHSGSPDRAPAAESSSTSSSRRRLEQRTGDGAGVEASGSETARAEKGGLLSGNDGQRRTREGKLAMRGQREGHSHAVAKALPRDAMEGTPGDIRMEGATTTVCWNVCGW